MTKKISWAFFAIFAMLIGIMPFIILLKGMKFGIEETKDPSLYANLFWKFSFYAHVVIGGIPILIGWTQFSRRLRAKYLKTHRLVGKIYVVTFLITALTAFFISFYATGGLIPATGFATVAIIAFYTTLKAYLDIRKGSVASHQKMMIYSYSCCFASVTLRLWQPILFGIFNDFEIIYPIVAWLAWLPNLGVAFLIVKKNERLAVVTT